VGKRDCRRWQRCVPSGNLGPVVSAKPPGDGAHFGILPSSVGIIVKLAVKIARVESG